MRRALVAATAALAILFGSALGGATADAKTVRWACYGNGFRLITTSYTWAYYLWNHGWDCGRIYDV